MAQQVFDDEILGKAFDARLTRKSLAFLKPYKRQILAALVSMLVVSAAALAAPKILQIAIDSGIKLGNARILGEMCAVSIGIYILRWIAQFAQTKLVAVLGQHVIYDMRQTLFSHIENLSLRFFDNREVGRIISRLTGDVSALNDLITSGSLQVTTDVLTVVGVVALMVRMNAQLSLLVFALCPFVWLSVKLFRSKSRLAFREVRRKVATVTATVAENVSGVRVVKSFSREGENLRRFKRVNHENQQAFMHVTAIGATFGSVIDLIGAVGTCMVLWYGGMQVKAGALTVGEVVAFLGYLGLFLTPMRSMSQVYQTMQSAMAGAERIFEILDTEPVIKDRPDATDLPAIRGQVDFDQVHFAYGDAPILKGISFSVMPGQAIALVGPTGAGKSTIINILGRQYDIQSGSIKIDGRDIRDVTLKSLRGQIGIVLQDSFLFPGSVKENIRYGRLNATDKEVEAAAKTVGAHEFIVEMPKGYDTYLNEGASNLSVGQKQLLAFARALLADPRILILDEATSSIDTYTELLIQEALRKLLKGRTSFVIAHRLSTISEADEILVIEGGLIAERGTHEALLENGGIYRKLYDSQFAYDLQAETAPPVD
jgi:ATP-binding cassette subfamily B protein